MSSRPVAVPMFGTEFSGEVHPYAAAFPMLPDADLDALAADIKANGMLNPIILDQDGRLLDGRNRLEACDRAGVEPTFTTTGAEPVALIVSANMQRRDLGAALKAYLAVEAGRLLGPNNRPRQQEIAAVAGVSRSLVAQVQVVAEHTPEAFQAVLRREIKHEPTYKAAHELKEQADLRAKQRAELEREWPDVLAKGLTLEEAWAAYMERTKKERERTEALAAAIKEQNRRLTEAVFYLHLYSQNEDRIPGWLTTYDPADAIHPITGALVSDAITALTAFKKGLKK